MKYVIGFIAGALLTTIFFTVRLKKLAETQTNQENTTTTAVSPDQSTAGLPADFEAFYLKFHQDSIYQVDHINFPLRGVPAQADSLSDLTNFQWEADNWRMHKPFDSDGGNFSRDFFTMGDLITEEIYTKDGFGMQRRFMKTDNDWYLIYYSAMNRMK